MRLVMALNHGRRRGVCASLCLSTMGERGEYAPHDRLSPKGRERTMRLMTVSHPKEKGSLRLMTVSHPKENRLSAPHNCLSP